MAWQPNQAAINFPPHGQSLKATLQLIAIIAALLTLGAWVDSKNPDRLVWCTRIAGPASKTPEIDVAIDCDGAAFGVHRLPWPIHAEMQGLKVKCKVGCSNKYPAGAGKLMRFREGVHASGTAGEVARAGMLFLGVLSNPSSVTLQMPKGVADTIPPDLKASTQILWRPDLPTGGFPVIVPTPRDATV